MPMLTGTWIILVALDKSLNTNVIILVELVLDCVREFYIGSISRYELDRGTACFVRDKGGMVLGPRCREATQLQLEVET